MCYEIRRMYHPSRDDVCIASVWKDHAIRDNSVAYEVLLHHEGFDWSQLALPYHPIEMRSLTHRQMVEVWSRLDTYVRRLEVAA